jgi:RNA polymerase sigma-70 factor (ECF subfamily)
VSSHPSFQVNPSTASAPSAPSPALSAFAFRALFDAEFRYVWNTLRYLGVRPADVQDIGQEVFLTVHRKLSAGEVPRSTRSWLFALCYNAASNYRQLARHRREAPNEDVPDAPDSARDAEAHLAAHQESTRVAEVLDALDLDRRTVLVSHDMDEIPMPEIADALGIPLNTAYSRLRLARRDFLSAARRTGLKRGAE